MGYNSSKGPQQMGDIQFESDPDDVQIDFAADYIAFKTNGEKRLIIDAATITSSVTHYFWNDITSSLGVSASYFMGDGSRLTSLPGDAISFNGSTANGILTYGGASTADVESQLTFDGQKFSVQSTVNPIIQASNTQNNTYGAVVELINTRAGSNPGVVDDFCGGIAAWAPDSVNNITQYGKISTRIASPTAGSNAGYTTFEVTTGGTIATTYLTLDGGTGVIAAAVPVSGSSTLEIVGETILGDVLNVSGSVAIGTTLPTSSPPQLKVDAPISGGATLEIAGVTALGGGTHMTGNVGINTSTPAYELEVYQPAASAPQICIHATAGQNSFLTFKKDGTEKSEIKQGSGGNLVITNKGTGGDIIFNCDTGTEVARFCNEKVVTAVHLSGASTMHMVGAATFGTTIAATGSITGDGVTSYGGVTVAAGHYSGSGDFHTVGIATFGNDVVASGSGMFNGLTSLADLEVGGGDISYGNAQNATLFIADGAGTNIAGRDLTLSAGNGTGTGVPGGLSIKVPKVGTSGATVHTAVEILTVRAEGVNTHWNQATAMLDDEGMGDLVYFGTGTTTAGKMYYLHSGSSWQDASCTIAASGGIGLLGIAIGSNPASNGMLVRGFYDVASYLSGAFVVGQPVYLTGAPPAAGGKIGTNRPSGSGQIVRVVGYCTTTPNVIYFNPSRDWIEIT
jgi:hypothetical protein